MKGNWNIYFRNVQCKLYNPNALFYDIEINVSIISILWWLFSSFVCYHIVFKCNEKIFHGGCVLPCLKNGKILNFSIIRVDWWNIYLVGEGHCWWFFRVFWSAYNRERVNSILEVSLDKHCNTLYGPKMVPFQ